MAFRPPFRPTKRKGQLKRIPRPFHQIALQIRFCRRPHINIVRFRWPGFLPTRIRRLIKRQLREFPQQSRPVRRRPGEGGMPTRDHVLFPRVIQSPVNREIRKIPEPREYWRKNSAIFACFACFAVKRISSGLRKNNRQFFAKRMSEISSQKYNNPPVQSEAGQFHFFDSVFLTSPSWIRKRVLHKLPQHHCRHSSFKLAFANHQRRGMGKPQPKPELQNGTTQ